MLRLNRGVRTPFEKLIRKNIFDKRGKEERLCLEQEHGDLVAYWIRMQKCRGCGMR